MSTITADKRVTSATRPKSDLARKLFEWGGFAAGAVLIAFGVVAIIMGFSGRSTVTDSLKQEKIVGSADMTPALIAKEAKDAGLTNIANMPTVAVAGQAINTGPRARAFASYMRIHALEATGGYTYAQMGRFQAKPDAPKAQLAVGGGTDNPQFALIDTCDEAAGSQRRSEPLGDRDRADDRTEHVLHGRQARTVRNRRRDRTAPERDRLHRSRFRGPAPQVDGRADELAAAQAGPAPGAFRVGAGPISEENRPGHGAVLFSRVVWAAPTNGLRQVTEGRCRSDRPRPRPRPRRLGLPPREKGRARAASRETA